MAFSYLEDTGHAFQGPGESSHGDGAEEGDEKQDAGVLQGEAGDSSDFDEADLDTSVAAHKGKACECSTW